MIQQSSFSERVYRAYRAGVSLEDLAGQTGVSQERLLSRITAIEKAGSGDAAGSIPAAIASLERAVGYVSL